MDAALQPPETPRRKKKKPKTRSSSRRVPENESDGGEEEIASHPSGPLADESFGTVDLQEPMQLRMQAAGAPGSRTCHGSWLQGPAANGGNGQELVPVTRATSELAPKVSSSPWPEWEQRPSQLPRSASTIAPSKPAVMELATDVKPVPKRAPRRSESRLSVKDFLAPTEDVALPTPAPVKDLAPRGSNQRGSTQLPPSKRQSAQYATAVFDSEKLIVIGSFEDRGKPMVQGAAFHDHSDIETYDSATMVGLAYQVNSLTRISLVDETFNVGIELSLVYKIDDSDKPKYEAAMKDTKFSFQAFRDTGGVSVKPPILEIRNATESVEVINERIIRVSRRYDHCTARWAWYALLYCQYRAVCFEPYEMHRFPFTRQCLQVVFVCKQPLKEVLLVPFNSRSALPHWELDAANRIREIDPRGNSFKAPSRTINNWNVETHHVAFVPASETPPMPSGSKFGRFLVVLQVTQSSTFYLCNSVLIVFPLTLLSSISILEDQDQVADRMSIVLALLVTMATYKTSICTWMPQKDYLTLIDIYILLAFGQVLAVGGVVGVGAWCVKVLEMDAEKVARVEAIVASSLVGVWTLGHICLLLFRRCLYLTWEQIIAQETESLREARRAMDQDRKELARAMFSKSPCPEPPVNDPPDPVAVC